MKNTSVFDCKLSRLRSCLVAKLRVAKLQAAKLRRLPTKLVLHVWQLYISGQRDKKLESHWSGASQKTVMLIATFVWLTRKTLIPKQSMRQAIQISHHLEDQLTIVLKYPFLHFLACLVYRVKTPADHKMKMIWSQILIFIFRSYQAILTWFSAIDLSFECS